MSDLDKDIQATPPAKKTRMVWKCTVCGHIERGYPDGLPKDYRCPICNAKPKKFVRVEIEE